MESPAVVPRPSRPGALLTAAALALALLLLSGSGHAAGFDPAVEAAQSALAGRGFDPGPVDGLMGRRTRGAIEAFQKSEKLPATGKLDGATREALGLASAAPAPPPTPGAAPPPAPPVETEARPSGRLLSYERLQWQGPESAESAAARSRQGTGIDTVTQGQGEILVADASHVFVLPAGETLPGEACEPGLGDLEMEFLFGGDGPVTFRARNARGFCQLGTGIVLRQGMRLRMQESFWGDTRYRAGTVVVGPRGLEYLN